MGSSERGADLDAAAPTAVVSGSGSELSVREDEAPTFERPETIERFVLGELLGAGGLGVVHEAWDPKLRRRVAVKLVRAGRRRRDDRGPQRFVREAQALARLSHPNVVAVYGVGTLSDGETVYVVMEHVDGDTLRVWSAQGRRSVDEIVEVFLAAGRGLAAAHAAGIVHRDFKPDNVMVDGRGRVRVLDFGLALVGGGPATDSVLGPPSSGGSAAGDSLSIGPDDRLTEAGVVMGTPSYMAPEQHRDQGVGPRSDQFSFCIAMLRVLRGNAPVFSGTNLRELLEAKTAGRVEPRPQGDRTPPWMEAVLLRGVHPDPADRWPSMDALLEALQRSPRRWSRFATAGVLTVAIGGVWLASRPEDVDCTDGADRLATRWRATDREAVSRALSEELGARGGGLSSRFEQALAADVTAWTDAFIETCGAHRDRVIDDGSFDRRMACLRDRATERERLLEGLDQPTPAALRRLRETLVGLEGVADCVDDARLEQEGETRPTPSDPRVRESVAAVREQLAAVDTAILNGEFDRAASIIAGQTQVATALGFEPLFAEVRNVHAQLEIARGHVPRGVELFEDALAAAESSGHDVLAAEVASALVFTLAVKLRRLDDAERMLAYARALLVRAGEPLHVRRDLASAESSLYAAQQRFDAGREVLETLLPTLPRETPRQRLGYSVVLNNLGLLHMRGGDMEGAAEVLREALELRQGALGEDHPKTGALHLNLGNAYARGGKLSDAETHLTRALELSYEDNSTDLARPLISRGVVRKKQGRFDEARADYERALELVAGGGTPGMEAMILANLGNLEKRVGNLDRALERHTEALAMREAELGPDHVAVADSLGDLGALHRRAGRFEAARQHYDRELSIRRAALGPEHPELVSAHLHRANLAIEQGTFAEAETELAEAQRIVAMHDARSPTAALTFHARGELLAKQARHEAAVTAFEEALTRLEVLELGPGRVGTTRLGLAKSLWAAGDRGAARDALSTARVELRRGGPGVAEDLAELETVATSWSGPQGARLP